MGTSLEPVENNKAVTQAIPPTFMEVMTRNLKPRELQLVVYTVSPGAQRLN